jgi:hypothetical protein
VAKPGRYTCEASLDAGPLGRIEGNDEVIVADGPHDEDEYD